MDATDRGAIPRDFLNMDSKIALIVCYFGKLPNYFRLTERTMGANPTIEWIIFGDQLPESNYPNVRMIPLSLNDYLNKVNKITGILPKNPTIYNLYNLKPLYGKIFEEYLKSYHYWGNTDLDILFGNLRKFLPEATLSEYDQIFARGHLVLYRNTPNVNEAYKLTSPNAVQFLDLLTDFNNPKHHQFDEWRGIHRILRHHGFRQYHKEVMADIVPPLRFRIGYFRTGNLPNYSKQIFYWHLGKTYRAYLNNEGGIIDEEVAYIHLQKRKFSSPPNTILNSRGMGTGPRGFFPYDREPLSIDDFDRLNANDLKPWKSILYDEYQRIIKKIQKIIQLMQ